jgi:eukaryotic-like serine/threonine-protein kinase
MRFAEGHTLGHYQILAPIGAGGMGEVYRAHDTILRRTVALKVLRTDIAGEARGLLLREARSASTLTHPHICTIYSVEEADGVSSIVMEHVPGRSLQELIKRGLPPEQIRRYGIQIARALAHAHAHHVIHRDLKSANIIVSDEGDAKVLDFGIAVQAVDGGRMGESSTLADSGTTAGTVAYMAPERLRGAPADARSDIWSLGVVLYEMATGSLPFQGETLFTLSAAILEKQMAPLTTRLSDSLRRVIERCLEKDPAQRYQNAGEVAASLETSDPYALPAPARWALKWPALAAALLAATAVGYVALSRGIPSTAPPAPPATTRSVAILPLQVIGGSPDEAHLGVGIADAIITRLAGVRELALRPTTAVLPYASTPTDPAKVGAALNVDQVIVGTIQPTSATYRVSLQLVRALDSSVEWVQTLDVSRTELLALQDTVAEQIVSALSLELTGTERERLKRRYTDNTDAYTLYVKGRVLLLNYTEANTRQAIETFNQALAIAPDYALARAGLATACAWFSTRYAYGAGASEWGERAEREARAALAADPSLGEAHLAIASAAGTLYRGFDWITVLEGSEQALALDPGLELAHLARMRAFYHLGEFERAGDERRRAYALNPSFNAEFARLDVVVNLLAGNYAEARDLATALLERTDAPVVRQYLGLALYYQGDPAKAQETLAAVRQGGQPDVRSQASLASIEAATGAKHAARQRALAVEHGGYMDHHVAYALGATWAQLGEPATAVRWLRRAIDTGFPCYPWFQRDSLLDPIRRDPAFVELLAGLEHRRQSR